MGSVSGLVGRNGTMRSSWVVPPGRNWRRDNDRALGPPLGRRAAREGSGFPSSGHQNIALLGQQDGRGVRDYLSLKQSQCLIGLVWSTGWGIFSGIS